MIIIATRDFIDMVSKMTPEELNKFIKENGKPPKKVLLYKLIHKEDISDSKTNGGNL